MQRYGQVFPAPALVPVFPSPLPIPPVLVLVLTVPSPAVLPPVMAASHNLEPLKLSALKDEKAFLDNYYLIQYYFHAPKFSTGQTNDNLLMDSSNTDAGWM